MNFEEKFAVFSLAKQNKTLTKTVIIFEYLLSDRIERTKKWSHLYQMFI